MHFRTKFALIVAAIVILLFFSFIAIMLGTVWSLGEGSPADGLSIASKILTALGALFIIAIVLAMIISAITWGQWLGDFKGGVGESEETPSAEGRISPVEELDRRYARGEITREEYLRMRDDLGDSRRRS